MPETSFRQGTIGRLQTVFLTQNGEIVEQPVGYPTVSVIYIDPVTLQPTTSVATTLMKHNADGTYYYDWFIPKDEPITEHQIIYRGIIDEQQVIGEDTVTVLAGELECAFTVSVLTSTCSPCCK